MRVETTITITKDINDTQKKKLLKMGQNQRKNYIYELCRVHKNQVQKLNTLDVNAELAENVYYKFLRHI